MKLLLDTHVLLWAASGSDRLSDDLRAALEDEANRLLFSAASIWEIAIKSALGRDDFRVEANALRRDLLANGYVELPITSDHAVGVTALPAIHHDPFDRMLAAQAIAEGASLVTADERLAGYPVSIVRA
jgi:PIN domain nuclease of toxin-antitoxin system